MIRHRLLLLALAVSSVAAMAAASGAQARIAGHKLTATPKSQLLAQYRASRESKSGGPLCVIHSLRSFTETGLEATSSSVADVIRVGCKPEYGESTVTISSDELSSRCHDTLSWYTASPTPSTGTGASFDVSLDNDGNATAVVWGGPSCAAGESLVSAHLDAPPYTTVNTTYTILPPRGTKRGVFARPSTEIEDSNTSSAATIVYAEFNPVDAEQTVTLRSNELDSRCAGGITWVGPDEVVLGTGPSVTTTLDDNGNAFVVALAGPSCAAGKSQIEASLGIAPFTSYLTSFNILSPRPIINP